MYIKNILFLIPLSLVVFLISPIMLQTYHINFWSLEFSHNALILLWHRAGCTAESVYQSGAAIRGSQSGGLERSPEKTGRALQSLASFCCRASEISWKISLPDYDRCRKKHACRNQSQKVCEDN